MKFEKAKPMQACIKAGMYGPPGSGKTLTSLMIGEYISEKFGGRIAVIDTEHGTDFYAMDIPDRTVHPKAFDFDAMYTRSITDVLDAAREVERTKDYSTLIIDSITHVWDACIDSYSGKRTKDGGIPMWAWGKIKKPYKKLMETIISMPSSVIICGRQALNFEEDSSGETKVSGYKMQAEGQTQYEMHILVRMSHGDKSGVVAEVEKDRTGILMGNTIRNPTANDLIVPIVPYLGGEQAAFNSEMDSLKDAEKLASEEAKEIIESSNLVKSIKRKMDECTTLDGLKMIGNEIRQMKSKFTKNDLSGLKLEYELKLDVFKKVG